MCLICSLDFAANDPPTSAPWYLKRLAYYTHNGSPVYSVFLYATKAFDRVNYCKLFDVSVPRKLSPIFLRLLLNMYTSHVTRIMWNGVFSERFLVKIELNKAGC